MKDNTGPGIAINDITVAYRNGTTALKHASFTSPRGSITALVGVNGAGKSTIFKAIMGFVPLAGGSISILGETGRQAQRQNRIAYVPQAEEVDWNFPVLVEELNELLGPKLVAYIAGVQEARTVRQWIVGECDVRAPVPDRLRLAFQVASLIAQHDSASVAGAWFQGLNPQLDDRSPARLLREGDIDEVGPEVIAAERAFLVGG